MRRGAAALLLASAISGAACGERPSSAEAARADSSAAGYSVGQRKENGGAAPTLAAAMTPPPNDTAAFAKRSAPPRGAMPDSATARPSSSGAPRTGARTGAHADSAKVSGEPTVAAASAGSSGRAHSDSASPSALPAGPVRVNEFLTYDVGSRTLSLQLIAGYNGLNGSLNYNGATKGSHGIYVPTGWRIHIAVTNRDSDLQHSAIVVEKVLPPPIEPTNPAFPGAALPQLDEGLHEDETATLDFVADHVGQYMIACGVPGHAQAGMWLQLAVSNGVTVPAYH